MKAITPSTVILAVFTLLSGLASATAIASNGAQRIDAVVSVHAFYGLLGDQSAASDDLSAYQAQIAKMMTGGASVELTDLGVTQTTQEFVESLEMFHEALDGGALAWRIEDRSATDDDGVSVLVCYAFASNMVLNREIVHTENGMIASITQTPVADHCDDL
jgi:hypothetical protein